MLVTHLPFFIDQHQRGHAPQFQKIHFLPEQIRDGMLGIGQADKGQFVFPPVSLVGKQAVGPDAENFRRTGGKVRVIVAQVREMFAAVRSHESAQ